MDRTLSIANVPSLGMHEREDVGNQLQATLVELIDLSLFGKQLHWCVVGRDFRSLHLQLDEMIDPWRELGDTQRLAEISERVRARMDRVGEVDAVSQDVLIDVARALEEQLRMVRAQHARGGA